MITMAFGISAMLNLASGSWVIVNDDVMGGRSRAEATTDEQGLRFSGVLSLENNGGFASTRRLVSEAPAGATGLRLQVRGDGRSYQVRLRDNQRFDGVAWRHEFNTSDQWQTLELDLRDFEPVFRGWRVPGAGDIAARRHRTDRLHDRGQASRRVRAASARTGVYLAGGLPAPSESACASGAPAL